MTELESTGPSRVAEAPAAPSLDAYRRSLQAVLLRTTAVSAGEALSVLVARDRIAKDLKDGEELAASDLLQLSELDASLKGHARRLIAGVGDQLIADWRDSRIPEPSAWWWFLDEHVARLDSPPRPVWEFIIGSVLLTISLSITAEIARRFLTDGASFLGVFSTLSSVVLSLLGGGALTSRGSAILDDGLRHLGVPRTYLHVSKLVVAVCFLMSVVILRLSLPSFASYFNTQGARLQDEGRLTAALESYQRAISLNPDFAAAHYNLATAYEDILDFDKELIEYQTAIRLDSGFYFALNNLARLSITRRADPSSALKLLNQAMGLRPSEPHVLFSIHKNRGWAYLQLGLHAESIDDLLMALRHRPDGAAAHCLLAQALEAPANPAADRTLALEAWTKCAAYGTGQREEVEGSWLGVAQARLRGEWTGGAPNTSVVTRGPSGGL